MKKKRGVKHSLSRRFSYALTGVVTIILFAFSAIVVVYNISETEQRLQQQFTRTAELAETSLASAVWQLNPSSINDILEAIFIDEAIVYASVISDGDILAAKTRSNFHQKDFSFFEGSSRFIAQTVDIYKDGHNIGTFQFALSRGNIRQELVVEVINTISLTILIIAAISITSILLTRRYILHPLATLVNFATVIATGELNIRVVSDDNKINPRDEIGELAQSFDYMRESLQQLISHIRNAGLKIQSSSDDIFTAVNKLTVVLEQQSASVVETTATMESVTTTSRKISGNTDVVVNMAEQTRMHSQKGVAMAEETLEKMQQIHDTNMHFLQKITILGERSENIGDVIQIINNIADQTKLIAFNAALEAVGTKDIAGKRFNVVALEIRRLADTIIESTQEIETNIREIQQGIRELVVSSDITTTSISEGAHYTETTTDWLREILNAAIRTTDEAKQIAIAIQEQQTANEHILLALQEISDGSKQFLSAGNQLSVSAEEMKHLSEELHVLLNKFGPGKKGN
jgi:methyl-accepting chemotaxis protein